MSARFLTVPLLALTIAAAAQAQLATVPDPLATPAAPVATPTIGLPPGAQIVPPPIVALPTGVPRPLPTPVATPTRAPAPPATRPVASPSAAPQRASSGAVRPAATPMAVPSARPTPVPTATTSAAAGTTAVTPVTTAPPVAPPVAATPVPDVVPAAAGGPSRRESGWLLPGVVLALLLGGLGIVLWRRRRAVVTGDEVAGSAAPRTVPLTRPAGDDAPDADVPVDALARAVPRTDAPEAGAAPAAMSAAPAMLERAPAAPVGDRAWLTIELRPRRAGVNLLTATLDAEIVVRNDGTARADGVQVALRLLSARAGQDDELAAVFAAPAARPVAPAFALEPGEARTLRGLATVARDAVNVLTVADRPMFVPVAAVDVRYRSDGAEGQTAEAFAVGVARPGAAKLAPVWLDTPARMHDDVGARPHTLVIRR
jgi:hypothetical protein